MNTLLEVNINGTAVLDQAMRRVRDHWPLAYSKLLAMKWLPTASTSYGCTDGRTLKLNPLGLDKLNRTSDPVGLTAFLLVHEALHALLSHGERLSRLQDHNTANIAADYVINAMIKRRNVEVRIKTGVIPFPFIEGILFDESISKDFNAEQLYQHLLKGLPQPPQPDAGDESGDAGDDDGAGEADGEGDAGEADAGEGDDGAGDDESGDGDGAGDGEGEAEAEADGAGDGAGAGEADGAGDATGEADAGEANQSGTGAGSSSGAARQTDKEILGDEWVGTGAVDTAKPELEDGETAEQVADQIDASNESILIGDQIDKRAGMSGAGGSRSIQQHRARREGLDWADVLRQWLSARCSDGWDKPFNAPIFTSTGTVAAGRQKKALPEIVVVVDTSCSVPDSLLAEMLAQLQHCLDTLRPEAIHLVSCDTRIREAHELREGDFVPTKLMGGGGTFFRPAFDWMRDNVPHAEGLVYLTDGEAWDFAGLEEPACPVLWLDYGKVGASAYPFGEVVSFSHR
jgi:predicted metal-dependent peptidase